tara:strand:- start:210 stop:818 length:609 start_codon:yes stop_codon:yes gene_type:complete
MVSKTKINHQEKNKGKIIIISGPSGVGKGSIIKEITKHNTTMHVSVSATTRPKRDTETHQKEYYFLTDSEFDQKINENAFLEWCHVHQHRYGTLQEVTEKQLNLNKNVILEVDVQGAKKIMNYCHFHQQDYISIFIIPPTLNTIKERLYIRKTESEDMIKTRLERAKEELNEKEYYQFIVINDCLNEAVKDVNGILTERNAC